MKAPNKAEKTGTVELKGINPRIEKDNKKIE